MTFSVVIAWRGSTEELRRCLRSLSGQPVDQIIVSRTPAAEFMPGLAEALPQVEWLPPVSVDDLPGLFWHALDSVDSEIVGLLESPAIAGPIWVEQHRDAHEAHPEGLAVGGPVRPPTSASGADAGWYWSEFAEFAPRHTAGPVRTLTDANVSYKRDALREHQGGLSDGQWGWHLRQGSNRMSHFCEGAWIEYPNPFRLGTALRERRHGARKHVAEQLREGGGRIAGLIAVPLLPLIMTWRGWQVARLSNYQTAYVAAAPWTLLFHCAWAMGELQGYVTGR